MSNLMSKDALVLFSGGLDSFLTTIKLIHSGYKVKLISFNNGSILGIERVFREAARLIEIYSETCVQHVGAYSVWSWKHRLLERFNYSRPIDLVEKYPNLPTYQLECLACHTAMYISAIAYCKSHGISVLAEGARISQGFIVEMPDMVKIYTDICAKHGIELKLPVLNLESDEERALELAEYNFVPKVFEPQCTLGVPLKRPMTNEEIHNTIKYFNDNMRSLVDEGIAEMTPILRVCKPRYTINGEIGKIDYEV